MEFAALATHRSAIRAEIAKYAERHRTLQTAGLARVLERYAAGPDTVPPTVLSVLVTGLSIVLVMDQAMGVSTGHAETRHAVERCIQALEAQGPEVGT